jgi:hypothetical protein
MNSFNKGRVVVDIVDKGREGKVVELLPVDMVSIIRMQTQVESASKGRQWGVTEPGDDNKKASYGQKPPAGDGRKATCLQQHALAPLARLSAFPPVLVGQGCTCRVLEDFADTIAGFRRTFYVLDGADALADFLALWQR